MRFQRSRCPTRCRTAAMHSISIGTICRTQTRVPLHAISSGNVERLQLQWGESRDVRQLPSDTRSGCSSRRFRRYASNPFVMLANSAVSLRNMERPRRREGHESLAQRCRGAGSADARAGPGNHSGARARVARIVWKRDDARSHGAAAEPPSRGQQKTHRIEQNPHRPARLPWRHRPRYSGRCRHPARVSTVIGRLACRRAASRGARARAGCRSPHFGQHEQRAAPCGRCSATCGARATMSRSTCRAF